MRVKAICNRVNARIRDDLGILSGLPYPPLGFFVQSSNVATNLDLDGPLPRECAVATAIKQLVNDGIPRRNRHSPLIGPFSEPLTDYTRGGLKFRDHALVGELFFCDGRFVDPSRKICRPFIRKLFISNCAFP